MSLNVTELKDGIAGWRKTRWPQDFHRAFYSRMHAANPRGNFTHNWWEGFLPELIRWRALRPRSPLFVSNRTVERFQRLSQAWTKCMTEEMLTSDISQVQLAQVATFVEVVSEIKDVASPVFTSKFCHFLAPRIFPVIDNAAMGNPFPTYKAYYHVAQSEWFKTTEQVRNNLMAVFLVETGVKQTLNYPLKCKIIELCLIGRNQSQKLSLLKQNLKF